MKKTITFFQRFFVGLILMFPRIVVVFLSCSNNSIPNYNRTLVVQAVTTTMINNPGFENRFDGWLEIEPASISKSNVVSGKRSAKISGSGGRVEQAVAVNVNTNYRLTAWVLGQGKVGVDVEGSEIISQGGNFDIYTLVTVDFNSGPTTTLVNIFGAYNGGTCRFDDFTIQPLIDDNDGSTPTTAPSYYSMMPTSTINQEITLINPSFESNFDGWIQIEPISISTSNVVSGTRAAKITGSGGRCEQAVAVTTNTNYQLTAWVLGSGTLGVKIGTTDEVVQSSGNYDTYTQVNITFNSGSAQVITIFGSYNDGTGRFDNFSLQRLDTTITTLAPQPSPPPTPEPIAVTVLFTNPSFESNFDGWTEIEPVSISTSNVVTGGRSAKITGSGGRFEQNVSVSTNTNYRLTAWVLGHGVIGVTMEGSTEISNGGSYDVYTLVTVVFNSSLATMVTIFGAYNGGTGRFDDFTLERLTTTDDDEDIVTLPPSSTPSLLSLSQQPTIITAAPSLLLPKPTIAPFPAPTVAPLPAPTVAPLPAPTVAPLPAPTVAPISSEPTVAPLPAPTIAPHLIPITTSPVDTTKTPTFIETLTPTISNSVCSTYEPLMVTSVTASTHDGNVPANTLDNNLGTRWSAEGNGQWILFDLGEDNVRIKTMDIAWYKGDLRVSSFYIETSSSDLTVNDWSLVYAGDSSGSTIAKESYNLIHSTARYVRIIGYGNTDNNWNSITEVNIFGCGQDDNNNDDVVVPPISNELDPSLPPGSNFNLSTWKITFPNASEEKEAWLTGGGERPNEFFTDPVTGGMVFRCPNVGGSTGGSSYSRAELREMLRAGDTSISTTGLGKNNWVFSTSSSTNQIKAGGVDGTLTATLTVDRVSTTGDSNKVGRVIVGQIHASNDEPIRLYYRKLPGNTKGSIYFAHEPTTGAEQWYDMIGSRSDSAVDPTVDGILLGEIFGYVIDVTGNTLTVTIQREGKVDVIHTVDMTSSGFANDWMYFKAGVYNQNNSGSSSDYAQATFYSLSNTHN